MRFQYEFRTAAGLWFRTYGTEQWSFRPEDLMSRREASINDVAIAEAERRFHWPAGPRPEVYPGLSDLGL